MGVLGRFRFVSELDASSHCTERKKEKGKEKGRRKKLIIIAALCESKHTCSIQFNEGGDSFF